MMMTQPFGNLKGLSGTKDPPKSHLHYKGSLYNINIEWETGEITPEPLHVIAADDPVTCTIYAKEQGLLDTKD